MQDGVYRLEMWKEWGMCDGYMVRRMGHGMSGAGWACGRACRMGDVKWGPCRTRGAG